MKNQGFHKSIKSEKCVCAEDFSLWRINKITEKVQFNIICIVNKNYTDINFEIYLSFMKC